MSIQEASVHRRSRAAQAVVERHETATLPEPVARLVNLVGTRYGIYFGKRLVQSEVVKATSDERIKMRELNKGMNDKIGAYLETGADVRDDVKGLIAKKAEVQKDIAKKSEPFSGKLSALGSALSYIDKVAMPQAYTSATGKQIVPIMEVPKDLLDEVAASKAAK